jgi:hypothetical protein
VGLASRLQQTPFEVISTLPSDVILPPPTAEVLVISVIDEVDNSGNSSSLQELSKNDNPSKKKMTNEYFLWTFMMMVFR